MRAHTQSMNGVVTSMSTRLMVAAVGIVLVLIACGPPASPAPEPNPNEPPQTDTVETPGNLEPLPPIPVMSVASKGQIFPGIGAYSCWPAQRQGAAARQMCGVAVARPTYPLTPVVAGETFEIQVEAHEPPTALSARLLAEPRDARLEHVELGPHLSATVRMNLPLGRSCLRVTGEWARVTSLIKFALVTVPAGDALVAECFYTEADPLPITFTPGVDRTPTAFDGRNSGTCRFSKPVSRVPVTLDSDAIVTHNETFHIEPRQYELSFPLPDDTPSEMTLESLPAGEYSREMVVIADDGDEWSITANIDAALGTVTVVRKHATSQ